MKRTRTPVRIAGLLVAAAALLPLRGLLDNPARAESAAEAAAELQGPQQLMESVAKRIFEALDANRAAIKKDPEKIYPLVDTILLPRFDTDYAAQLVLAQTWRTATAEQRKRFITALYRSLLRTYGAAIGDFTADRLKILPFRGDPTANQVTVRTLVTRANGATVPVDYRMRRTTDGWKAFDVIIEGISYIKNYRTDLGTEISQTGLDAVIERLEKEGSQPKPAAAKAGAAKR